MDRDGGVAMMIKKNKKGSVLLVSVFVSALFGAMVVGMMQLNTEEMMLTGNYIELTKAIALAEAGLEDSYYELGWTNPWRDGFTNKSCGSGTYTVTVQEVSAPDPLIYLKLVSTGTTAAGYKARVDADIIVKNENPYNTVRIIEVRIND
jgi:Tfp pilus assembly protein PilX